MDPDVCGDSLIVSVLSEAKLTSLLIQNTFNERNQLCMGCEPLEYTLGHTAPKF